MDTKSFYDQWTGLLRKNAPSLENPEELTFSIMEKIESLPVKGSTNRITYWTTLLSGVAACWLFCLLIYEFNRPMMSMPATPMVITLVENSLPKKMEDLPHFLKERERRATAYHEWRIRLAQNYQHISSSDI